MTGELPGERISYQRMPARSAPELPTLTVWEATSVSWSPKLRYCRRNIRRSASGSSSFGWVPGWGMHPVGKSLPQNDHVYGATGTFVGPVRVEVAGVAKSAWAFQI